MDTNIRDLFVQYAQKLGQYQFTWDNPVFWLILIVLALILTRFWDIKKSFSFSISVAVVLLLTTKIERAIVAASANAHEFFDPVVIRILSVIVITLVVLYYIFIKSDSAY